MRCNFNCDRGKDVRGEAREKAGKWAAAALPLPQRQIGGRHGEEQQWHSVTQRGCIDNVALMLSVGKSFREEDVNNCLVLRFLKGNTERVKASSQKKNKKQVNHPGQVVHFYHSSHFGRLQAMTKASVRVCAERNAHTHSQTYKEQQRRSSLFVRADWEGWGLLFICEAPKKSPRSRPIHTARLAHDVCVDALIKRTPAAPSADSTPLQSPVRVHRFTSSSAHCPLVQKNAGRS